MCRHRPIPPITLVPPAHEKAVVPRGRVALLCQAPPARLLGRDRVPSTSKRPKRGPVEPKTSLGLSCPYPGKAVPPPQRLIGQTEADAAHYIFLQPTRVPSPDISLGSMCPSPPLQSVAHQGQDASAGAPATYCPMKIAQSPPTPAPTKPYHGWEAASHH